MPMLPLGPNMSSRHDFYQLNQHASVSGRDGLNLRSDDHSCSGRLLNVSTFHYKVNIVEPGGEVLRQLGWIF